ncbi:Alkyl hydroperoxide reductase AhpD [Bosea sp. 62]|uniref:carboxymuconolactone decarboxylase family protein n=1 Tax=unclassified Bosea (in: a-proteobacteria) TaxID=2653178 RepID=UPI0012533E4C|nr:MULTISPECIES: carboxymuconolactone decarboxylase family protein [unclassified Bosea (in: a-proteobacteria)]CAD5265563.1 Alkyl hydroperoxide reductase AhpD [Bosea sp. 46]CAD5267563.1 Alkyl hydroperoxide reductase AhpD [Bosea sp. 21B]CAD5271453.1 Alkyl hydroperoxide reductase AhpD [Bosea sp. 7B]VVT55683.1 Alkyl hydroperoxide reductase AhpD [Bosea sp. EC-HK365B]VXB86881.1 Alkyl hydroperoxide reductase AhpD [Bosea sp. 29B]
MSRIAIPSRAEAPEAARPLLDAVEKQLGSVPNLFRLLAQSPAALEGFLGLNGALGRTLNGRLRESVALAVAQSNGCDYCLSAHSYLGANLAKLDVAEIARNRAGGSSDPRSDAALRFALRIVETRGRVSDAELAEIRSAGFSEAQLIEIVGLVAVNVFTNYLNNLAETDIDFPVVLAAEAA